MADSKSEPQLWDIINMPEFKKAIEDHIYSYLARPILSSDKRYKRTPADTLIDKGIFDFLHIKGIFIDIFNKNLVPYPYSVRSYIQELCIQCAVKVMKEKGMLKEEENG